MASTAIHVFSATFKSSEEASAFAHPQWEPEPDEHVSDEEYADWEDRNPIWRMREELGGPRIDDDFVEVIWNDGMVPNWDYLKSRLSADDVLKVIDHVASANTLVLVDQTAFNNAKPKLHSTANLEYHGSYRSVAMGR